MLEKWGWDVNVNGFLSKLFHFYWYLSVIHPLLIATAYPALSFIEGPDLFPDTVGGGGGGGRVHLRSCQRIAGLTPSSIRSWKQCQVANTSGWRAFVHRWKEAGISGGKPQGQNTNVTQKGFALGHKPKTLSLWGGTSSYCTRPVIIPHIKVKWWKSGFRPKSLTGTMQHLKTGIQWHTGYMYVNREIHLFFFCKCSRKPCYCSQLQWLAMSDPVRLPRFDVCPTTPHNTQIDPGYTHHLK